MTRSTCMTVQVLAAGLVAYLSEKLGFTFYLLGILFVLMVIDYFSGMGASAIEALDHPGDNHYGWSSRKGAKGIVKKVAYFCVIVAAMAIDYVLIKASGQLGLSLPVNVRLSLLVSAWYLVNEALSITENAGRMGAPVPEWLAKYIAVLKNKIDGQVDKKE